MSSISTYIPDPSHNLHTPDEQRLKQLALKVVEDYPDVYGMAYAEARTILKKHTAKYLDPSRVYWHRFGAAQSSTRAFTGWAHQGVPTESMTLVELVMHRFSAHDQEAPGELQMYGGFYTDDAQHGVYDERNEVAILPQDVLRDFWALDFSSTYTNAQLTFWHRHSETFVTLAKARFLAAAGLQRREGRLSRADFELITHAIIGKLPPVMTLSKLQAVVAPGQAVTLRTFDLGSRVSAECIRVVHASGRQILYIPSDTQPFHAFDSDEALYQWVQSRLLEPEGDKRLKKLFLRSEAAMQHHGPEFDLFLQRLRTEPWNPQRPIVNQLNYTIAGAVFVYLRDIARREMESDATALLTSNASLRKQMWIGYLDAFIHVFGSWAPLAWPVALTLVGAGFANLALNIDQAVSGRTAGQRKAGIIGIVSNAVFIVFNLPVIAGLASAGELSQAGQQLGAASEGADFELLEAGDTPSHESIEMIDLHSVQNPSVPMQGIEQLSNGETWISLVEMPYRVRYNAALHTWEIIYPADSLACENAQPVHLNIHGEWELSTSSSPAIEPVTGLSSNLTISAAPYRTTRSAFWDTYMQFNLQDEERLSELGLVRQKELLNLRVAEQQDELTTDSDGSEIYIDSWGDENRVYRTPDGHYFSSSIATYTARDDAFNQFLRTGISEIPEQARLITRLDNDLLAIGHNNDVTLYRGGSGARGTSGLVFRSGQLTAGDVLVNTDVTSFSENPYLARVFASSQAGRQSAGFVGDITFDDTSVVFELPARRYLGATPIAPFSGDEQEVESIFMPGHYFQIEHIEQVTGLNYKFMKVRLFEIATPRPERGVYDFRTGALFSRSQYAGMLGQEGAGLVDRFFPLIN